MAGAWLMLRGGQTRSRIHGASVDILVVRRGRFGCLYAKGSSGGVLWEVLLPLCFAVLWLTGLSVCHPKLKTGENAALNTRKYLATVSTNGFREDTGCRWSMYIHTYIPVSIGEEFTRQPDPGLDPDRRAVL